MGAKYVNKVEDSTGYKKTKIGVLPSDWEVKKLSDVSCINRESLNGNIEADYEFYYYDLSCVDNGKIYKPNNKIKFKDAPSRARRVFQKNDILFSMVRPYLKGFAYIDFECKDCICSTGFSVISSNKANDAKFIYYNLFGTVIENQVNKLLVGSNYPAINSSDVENLKIPYPKLDMEREKIGNILSTWDKAIELKEKLIEQKKEQKKGLMQNLLTGKIRWNDGSKLGSKEIKKRLEMISQGKVPEGYKKVKWFIIPWEWSFEKIGNIAEEVSITNKDNKEYTVLSCTKYDGLVDSLKYFGKQVFSENLTNYKVVKRNHFVYATNHIEEGSIGLQKLYDYGLVSPMYTVFKTKKEVDNDYLYFLLKTETYRRIFETMMSASVDRRGSLRWKDFSTIHIPLPPLYEQQKIAEIILTSEKEIEVLEKELEALKQQKKGLMQLLLTGKVRVKC